MWQTPPHGHDLSYIHEACVRNADSETAKQSAVKRARKWAKGIVSNIATAASAFLTAPTSWLSDTGSGNDLVSKSDIDVRLLDLIMPTDAEYTLFTANGPIPVTEKALLQVAPLGEVIEPLVMESCPPVLTVGKSTWSRAGVSTGRHTRLHTTSSRMEHESSMLLREIVPTLLTALPEGV